VKLAQSVLFAVIMLTIGAADAAPSQAKATQAWHQ
jgi:hypothetical protein